MGMIYQSISALWSSDRKSRFLFRNLAVAVISLFVISFLFSACTTTKNVTYFRDIPDTLLPSKVVDQATYTTPLIQADDVLQISIQTLDPAATAMLNQQNTASWPVTGSGSSGGASGAGVSGYLVDKDGYVALPLIGKMMVKGKTTAQVRDDITKKASEFYKDPVVNVRYANFKITVLGEVAHPSSYVMPNEKVTLLDAIGVAGDLTIYGKRENVMLIRENNGKKEFVRFNLNNSNLFTSPYYYLQQGDVVYVEANKAKIASTDAARLRTITIITSAVSILTLIMTRVRF